jgi:hypothetical protein
VPAAQPPGGASCRGGSQSCRSDPSAARAGWCRLEGLARGRRQACSDSIPRRSCEPRQTEPNLVASAPPTASRLVMSNRSAAKAQPAPAPLMDRRPPTTAFGSFSSSSAHRPALLPDRPHRQPALAYGRQRRNPPIVASERHAAGIAGLPAAVASAARCWTQLPPLSGTGWLSETGVDRSTRAL